MKIKSFLIIGLILSIIAISGCTSSNSTYSDSNPPSSDSNSTSSEKEEVLAESKPVDDGLTVISIKEIQDIPSDTPFIGGTFGFDFLAEDNDGNLYVFYKADAMAINSYLTENKPFKIKYEELGYQSGGPYHENTREVIMVYDMDGKPLY